MTTSFGLEGCVLIDMCAKLELPIRVADIDTGFLFPETQQLKAEMIAQYPGLTFESWQTPLTPEQQAEQYGSELWNRDPNQCCHLRKVLPMEEKIGGFRVWITAIRRDQSVQRADTDILQWDWKYSLLKACPLAHWSRDQVWEYVQTHRVPHNRLHYEGYPSIGCTHCTRKVPGITSPAQYSREGRWQDKEKTECGLHWSKSLDSSQL
jgi:phosphoadenosine phosphosulfate reductase